MTGFSISVAAPAAKASTVLDTVASPDTMTTGRDGA